MFLELPDRVAIVTGAARGIGFAIAERLSRAGARVVVADVDEEGALEATERLREGGRRGRRADRGYHQSREGRRDGRTCH